MQLSNEQIDRIRAALPGSFPPELREVVLEQADEATHETLWLLAMDAMTNDGTTVETLYSIGCDGPFPIQVRGVDGAYYCFGADFDPCGVFDHINAAVNAIYGHWDPFPIFSDLEEADAAYRRSEGLDDEELEDAEDE